MGVALSKPPAAPEVKEVVHRIEIVQRTIGNEEALESTDPSAMETEKDVIKGEETSVPLGQRIIINVGGTRFETFVDTIAKHGTSTMLGAMLLSFDSKLKSEYFIDRDPELFKAILGWYRSGILTVPAGVPREVMEEELNFYGIPKTCLRTFNKIFHLSGKRIWSCKKCGTNFATHGSITSKNFHGNTGTAYLFKTVVNVKHGNPEKRRLASGEYLVKDVSCIACETTVGWFYVESMDFDQKYKEGQTVLEKSYLVKESTI